MDSVENGYMSLNSMINMETDGTEHVKTVSFSTSPTLT